ncbi:MAG: DUF1080 domain-containing protein [Verrucomicrobiota bacterium]|nr:DUF1080 domain-containing protein [Verrucomicrobiota bacterium]
MAGCETAPSKKKSVAIPQIIIAPSANSGEKSLFNKKDLEGWAITDFGGHGGVRVENQEIKIDMGAELSGIAWTNSNLPKINYEISLEAMKREGNDFFCALTFPVHDSFCSLIVGGWGGSVVGLSSVDRMDASENDTSKSLYFERNRWYRIRVRVTPEKIEAWIDDQKVVDLLSQGRKISMRPGEIERSQPLGIATWQTSATVRNIKLAH